MPMFFTRTHKFQSPVGREELKNRLIGKHVRIHNLDFEVFEQHSELRIIPHAERVNSIKTLPITHVQLREKGNGTEVVITSKMRKIDAGGPQLILIFCAFLLIASGILWYVGGEKTITYTMLSIGILIFVAFLFRMQMGYFDYVRKVRGYVRSRGKESASEMNMPMAAM